MELREAQRIVSLFWNTSELAKLLAENARLRKIFDHICNKEPFLEESPRGSGRIPICRELQQYYEEFAETCIKKFTENRGGTMYISEARKLIAPYLANPAIIKAIRTNLHPALTRSHNAIIEELVQIYGKPESRDEKPISVKLTKNYNLFKYTSDLFLDRATGAHIH